MRRAFTLIELLVVVSIIALLIAILLPVLSSVKYESKNLTCMTRQRGFVQATISYTVENKGLYPDRGTEWRPGNDRLWARWAMRSTYLNNEDRHLDETLGEYIGKDIAVWCCPLYDGAHSSNAAFGCLTHGRGHMDGSSGNLERYTTYSFHAGLVEMTNAGHTWNPGDRLKYGDPYIVELSDGRVYETGLLFSDNASGDNSWVPVYDNSPDGNTGDSNPAPFNGVTTNHAPPSGSEAVQIGNASSRTYAVNGRVYSNYAYDDGSAEVKTLSPGAHLTTSDEWTAVQLGGRRYIMLPN